MAAMLVRSLPFGGLGTERWWSIKSDEELEGIAALVLYEKGDD